MIDLIFALLFLLCPLFAVGVIRSESSVHSVLCLVGVFLCVSLNFFILKLDFTALALVMLYLGAIVVLFLFVVMMVDDELKHRRMRTVRYNSFCFFSIAILTVTLISAAAYHSSVLSKSGADQSVVREINGTEDSGRPSSWVEAIALTMFSRHGPNMVVLSALLLVSIIGAITLAAETMRKGKRQQSLSEQLKRSGTVKLNKVEFGSGVKVE